MENMIYIQVANFLTLVGEQTRNAWMSEINVFNLLIQHVE